jgi:serine phosphatase RsbU (regulator of sigma subunit)
MLQGVFASYVPTAGGRPATTLKQVNDVLLRRTTESRFVTLVYGRLDATEQLMYCNGGHNPPMLIGQRGRHRLDKGGPNDQFHSALSSAILFRMACVYISISSCV